jgi:hypothetical protein
MYALVIKFLHGDYGYNDGGLGHFGAADFYRLWQADIR